MSGFTGVAVAKTHYLNGCARVYLQPVVKENGELPNTATFDEPQLEGLSPAFIPGNNTTGGPEKYVDVRRY